MHERDEEQGQALHGKNTESSEAQTLNDAVEERNTYKSPDPRHYARSYTARCLGIATPAQDLLLSKDYAGQEHDADDDFDTWSTGAVYGGEDWKDLPPWWRQSSRWRPNCTVDAKPVQQKKEPEANDICCKVCNMHVNGGNQWLEHLKGKKHRKNVKALKESLRNVKEHLGNLKEKPKDF